MKTTNQAVDDLVVGLIAHCEFELAKDVIDAYALIRKATRVMEIIHDNQ